MLCNPAGLWQSSRLVALPFARLATILVLTTSVVAACVAEERTSQPLASVIALRTMEAPPPGTPLPCPAAALEGQLVEDARWGLAIVERQSGRIREVIWPHGYAARLDASGLVLLDQRNQIVARAGERLRVGGGELGGDGPWLACGGITRLES
jgi:hypothetical protein